MHQHQDLINAAVQARSNAYAPFSVYSVGAAVQAEDGRVFVGCNVENASYGLTVCAERNAVAAMVCAGSRKLTAVAVATRDGEVPCGACLQVLCEFASPIGVTVVCFDENGKTKTYELTDLAPHTFRSSLLDK